MGAECVVSAQQQLSFAITEDQAAAESFLISDVQYHAGTIDILSVLQSQQLLFQADNVLIQSRLSRFMTGIELYQALGRGWNERDQDVKLVER